MQRVSSITSLALLTVVASGAFAPSGSKRVAGCDLFGHAQAALCEGVVESAGDRLARPATRSTRSTPDRLAFTGSVRKLFSVGVALNRLGPSHRFLTPVYRTGAVDPARHAREATDSRWRRRPDLRRPAHARTVAIAVHQLRSQRCQQSRHGDPDATGSAARPRRPRTSGARSRNSQRHRQRRRRRPAVRNVSRAERQPAHHADPGQRKHGRRDRQAGAAGASGRLRLAPEDAGVSRCFERDDRRRR